MKQRMGDSGTGECMLKEVATSSFQLVTAMWKQAQCCQISQFLQEKLEIQMFFHVKCLSAAN